MSDQEQMKTDLDNTNGIESAADTGAIDTSGDKDGADHAPDSATLADDDSIVELVLGDDGVYYDSEDNVYKIVEAFSD